MEQHTNIFTLFNIMCILLLSISLADKENNSTEQDFSHVIDRAAHNRMRQRSVTNIVDIGMFTDSSAPGKVYSVLVDSTMTRLIVEIKVDRSNPVSILAKPSGLPGPRPRINGTASTGTVTATIDVSLNSTDYGIWKLTKLDANTWNVKIKAESSLDFTYRFLVGSFIQIPITGDPVQGETYKTDITVADTTLVKSVDLIQVFILEKVTAANMFPPHNDGNGVYSADKLTMLDKDFMIGIQGKDTSGNFFRRIKLIKPIALILSVPSFTDFSVRLYENTKLDMVFYVINKLSKEQDVDVRIQDTQALAESPTIISATLKPGQNFTGKFTLDSGVSTFGVSTNVTITAKPYLGPGKKKSSGPSVMRQFIVVRNITTTSIAPSTSPTTISTTGVSQISLTDASTRPNSKASTIATTVASTYSSSVTSTISTSNVTPNNIISAAKLRKSASSLVDINMFTDSSAPGKVYSVYVDSTMTRLIVEVKVHRSNPVAIIAKPNSLPGPRPSMNGTASAGTVTATFDVALTSTDYGIWKLTKLDASTWNVKVQAESSLDFTYKFLSGSFIQMPITEVPVQGETYKTVITVVDNTLVKSVDLIQLFVFEKVTAANMFPPHNDGNGIYSVDKMTMLDKNFMIGIQGRDNSGKFFRRIKVIKPVALLLSVPSFNDSSVKLYENKRLDLLFYVINKLRKEQDIDIRIQDTQGLAETPTIISATLKPGQNFTGYFKLDGGILGVSTDVTITAKPYLGPGRRADGPSVTRTFTVERIVTSPTSSVIASSSLSQTQFNTTTTPSSTWLSLSTVSSSSINTKTEASTIPLSPSTVSTTSFNNTVVPSTTPLSFLVVTSNQQTNSLSNTSSNITNSKTTSTAKTKANNSKSETNGFLSILSALLFNNGKSVGSGPRNKHLTVSSERLELDWN